ncbi:MAG: glycosyltransferase [Oscillospiraceae bacterium]|nr:glycosyltransferase [Oscillospiraceae bacterium]
MGRIKLAIIISRFGVGGAENMVYELIRKIDQSCFDVHVICYMPRCNTPLEMKAEKVCPIHFLGISGRVGISAIKCVLDALTRIKPDVVHAHLGGVVFGAIWTMIHRKPFVVTVHTKPDQEFTNKIKGILKCRMLLKKWVMVAVSPENEKLVREFYGVKDNRCICITNGVDVDKFYKKDHDHFTLINLAKQDNNKNQAAILKCFSKIHKVHSNTRLILAGDGILHQFLTDLAVELGVQESVVFPGMVSNAEDYYAVSDVYVQSSHREAMPLSVLEAMAAGLPIISTDVGGLRDVVKGNGLLVPDNDENALYIAMEKMISATNCEMDAMSRISKSLAMRYSSKTMACQYMDLYINVCNKWCT